MEIKDLNKPQLVLLTLLISFVVSIATGITAVSLLSKVPTTVSQTINKVIHETISKDSSKDDTSKEGKITTTSSGLSVSVYDSSLEKKLLGEGIVISEAGIVMIESSLLTTEGPYIVTLNKQDFTGTVVKKFTNGTTLIQITEKGMTATPKPEEKKDEVKKEGTPTDTKTEVPIKN